ncbi:MAG TPA: TonB-dependent receptor plug domain-containing protein, partial [Burkholderiaceae bacterium]
MTSTPRQLATLALAASACTFACVNAFAQAKPAQLDPIFVSATRSPLPISQVLADVTIITREDIERQPYGSVADLLRAQGGFELVRNGGPTANTSLFVRGADTRHTAVLIDGVRFDSQASSGASWPAIPLGQIERIEIVRGAASALYGSDAIGGVVQIFTRKGDQGTQFDALIGTGNRGLYRGELGVRGTSGIVDYAVS